MQNLNNSKVKRMDKNLMIVIPILKVLVSPEEKSTEP
jgi:hypothetical protein